MERKARKRNCSGGEQEGVWDRSRCLALAPVLIVLICDRVRYIDIGML
jgi:hypothetical protein